MFKYKIREVLLARGKKYPYRWLVQKGFSRNKAYNYLNNRQESINLADLAILCEGLTCTPNDLLYWENTPQFPLPDFHPVVQSLKKPSAKSDWHKLLSQMTPDKIELLHTKIENGEIEL
ncbi:MAG: helix-turn-helix transcriptional regulator [Bacteroidota bacterium]